MAEKFTWLTPYNYCAGDPVNLIDPTGCYLVDDNKNEVTLTNGSWSSNVTSSIKKVCGSMMGSEIGTKLVNDMLNADYPISINIVNGYYQDKNGNNDTQKLGNTTIRYNTDENGVKTIEKADIEIYSPVVEDVVACSNTETQFPNESIEGRYKNNATNTVTETMVIGGCGVHEATHSTEGKANATKEPIKSKREDLPIKNEINHIKTTK